MIRWAAPQSDLFCGQFLEDKCQETGPVVGVQGGGGISLSISSESGLRPDVFRKGKGKRLQSGNGKESVIC